MCSKKGRENMISHYRNPPREFCNKGCSCDHCLLDGGFDCVLFLLIFILVKHM